MGDIDPLDGVMGAATIYGTYIAYKGYKLSKKEFELNCAELGISLKAAVTRAGETYESYLNSGLQEKNEMIQDANQILSNDMDTMNQSMEKVYNNYGINKSESQEGNNAIHDANSLQSMAYALKTADKYTRALNANTEEINDYTHYTEIMNKLKNSNLKKIINNTAKEYKNTTMQDYLAHDVISDQQEEEGEVDKIINGNNKKTPVGRGITWAHP